MRYKNGYLSQLIRQYKNLLKEEGIKRKTLRDYVLLVTHIKRSHLETFTLLQLRTLEEITAGNSEKQGIWATLETTLVPVEYVHKIIQSEITDYSKKRIFVHHEGTYNLIDFCCQDKTKIKNYE